MLQKSTLLILISLLFSGMLSAQICTPDTSFTTPGIYPSNLPDGCLNQMYDDVITVVVPQDTTINIPPFGNTTVPIDSIVLVNVKNLQTGLSYACGNPSCGFAGNTSGCIRLSGTPTVAGTNTLKIITDVHVTLPIVGAQAIRDSSFTVQFTVGSGPSVVSTSTVDASCGQSNGSATVAATGGGPFTFTWSTGLTVSDTVSTLANVAAGTYSVNIASSNGCDVDTTITIANAGGPVVNNPQAANISCNGAADGSVTLGVMGGTAPYSYAWSNGDTTQNISNLGPGNYSVTITDAANCVANYSVTLTEPPVLVLMLESQSDVLCNGDMNGAASVTGSGGTGNLAYSWSTGANTTGVNNLPVGTHTAYITDDNGCMDSVSVTISEPDELTSTSGGENTLTGLMIGRAWVTPVGGTPPYDYVWSNGGVTDTISNLGAGEYTVTIVDNNSCTVLDTVLVNADPNSIEDDIAAGISNWEVFPNPTSQDVNVIMDFDRIQEVNIDLFDMNGRLIERQSARTQRWQGNFNLSNQARGLYLMRVSTSQGASTRKIVKN